MSRIAETQYDTETKSHILFTLKIYSFLPKDVTDFMRHKNMDTCFGLISYILKSLNVSLTKHNQFMKVLCIVCNLQQKILY
jgi:hypothetical protein